MDPVRGKSSEGGYEMKALVNAPFVRRMTKHLTEEDEAGIAAAVIPTMEPAEPELIAAIRGNEYDQRKVLIQGLPIAAAGMIPGFIAHSLTYCLAVGITIIVLLVVLFFVNRRCRIGDDAEKMVIPIDHIEGSSSKDYAVFYLPDGKYRMRCELNRPNPVSVTVLRSEGRSYCKLNGKEKQS